jgi:peptide-methionine (S)-S-oxide reductase
MSEKKYEVATFAAGCFWGVEEAFRVTKGVKATMVGYTGGKTKNPTYQDVCTDNTGHAEAIQIEFDPDEVSYEKLLDLFWSIHDPTTINRQGPDIGSQYRSMIGFHTKEQEQAAIKSRDAFEKSGIFKNKIVTEIVPASTFYKAEEYHQKYYMSRGGGSCYIRPIREARKEV